MPSKKQTKKEKPTLVLIDAHAVIHRAYHALPDLTDKEGQPAGALYGLSSILLALINELKPEYIVAAYDLEGPTHRHDVYEDYKGTRSKTDDALVAQFDRSRDVFEAFHIPIYEAEGFEADDVIGTLAKKVKKDFEVVVASGDMDTLQLVDKDAVRVFTLRKGIKDTVMYNEDAVVDRYGFTPEFIPDFKGFAGDPSDNIIGISGVGEKTATKLIQTFGSVEKIYKALKKDEEGFKEKAGLTERVKNLIRDGQEEAEFSKVLATIRIDAPVKFSKDDAEWRESFTSDKAIKLFTEWGFRSLVPRIKQLAGDEPKKEEVKAIKGEKKESDNATGQLSLTEEYSPLAEEAKVLLFLVQSETTNPSIDDVLNETGAKTIEEAHSILVERAKKENVYGVFETIEQPLIPVVKKVNDIGVLIDIAYLKELSKEYHKELTKVAKKIYKVAGEEFNLNSPKQLGEVLLAKLDIKGKQKKTSTGQVSTKESELIKLQDDHPVIKDVLQYRELQKLVSTYIDAIPPLVGKDGRLRTTFIQTGAATGRFASHNPNLQNIPIKTESGRRIRGAFVAEKGWTLMAFDYSQIELRLAAVLSHDEKLRNIFINGDDVHSAVAAEVFNVAPDKVEYEMRRRAKVINFGILYGMGVNALRVQLGTDRKEAQEYLNEYFETFTGLSDYLAKTKGEAARVGYTTTMFGRKRFFPGIKSKLPFIRASNERMAINAPIQGTQADIIKLAMVKIAAHIESTYPNTVRMVLQIHDELVFEVKKDVADAFAKDAKSIMESIVSDADMHDVPLAVSGESGENWGSMKSLSL